MLEKVKKWFTGEIISYLKEIKEFETEWKREVDAPMEEVDGELLDFIKVLRLKPGDVLCLKAQDRVLNTDQILAIEKKVKNVIGERNNVLVLSGEWHMNVVRYDTPELEE